MQDAVQPSVEGLTALYRPTLRGYMRLHTRLLVALLAHYEASLGPLCGLIIAQNAPIWADFAPLLP